MKISNQLMIHIYFLFVYAYSVFAQKNVLPLDSLNQAYHSTYVDTSKLMTLIEIASQYRFSNPDTSLFLAQKALKWAQKIKFNKAKAWAWNRMALIYMVKGNRSLALTYYQKAEKLFLKTYDKRGLAYNFNNLGSLYMRQNAPQLALTNFQQALKLFEEIQEKSRIAINLTNIGDAYTSLGNDSLGIVYYQKGAQAHLRNGDKSTLWMAYNTIGNNYLRQNNMKSALEYFSKALKNTQDFNDTRAEMYCLGNLALLYRQFKHYEKSNQYAILALEISQKHKWLEFTKDVCETLSENHKEMGDFSKALQYFQLFQAAKDSLYSVEKEKIFNNLETKYALEKKQQEIKLLQSQNQLKIYENRQKNTILFTTLGGLVLLAGFTFFLYQANQQKQKTAHQLQEKNEELFTNNQQLFASNVLVDLLFSELNHRVLNNLQVVLMLISSQKRKTEQNLDKASLEKIEYRISELVNIHRLLMYGKNRQKIVDLAEYLHNITETLNQLYQADNQIVSINIDAQKLQLPLSQAYFLGFIVYELFTNALKYAYQEVEIPEFNILISQKSQVIELKVSDNGKGMPAELWENGNLKTEMLQTLGLKIVSSITQIYQGSFTISQPANQIGSLFIAKLIFLS